MVGLKTQLFDPEQYEVGSHIYTRIFIFKNFRSYRDLLIIEVTSFDLTIN